MIKIIDQGGVEYYDVECDGRIVECHRRLPRIGECVCGEQIYLTGFTNTCNCGREYNSFGQELAPREQWGEETGEHPADIARIP